MANFNEQYSRKNNVKILNWTEPEKTPRRTDNANEKTKGENLRQELIKILKEKVKVSVEPQEIFGIHRIPGKKDHPRPVIVKFVNTETKVKVMRQRKALKKTFKVVDNVTKHNMSLITKLSNDRKLNLAHAYYFNGHVYGVTEDERRHRYDIDILDDDEESDAE
ncbi:hypothetical protein FSP39_007416 [Pinctada imbricata]|uniref:Uncharacterized protein n=1 Tax=Pinctada imbricata TaxID=66713 RepID=A0AA88YUU3_PINIB|nr:hypothetical protein FSP39_007416 [Pinctada imbricata]